MFTVGLFPRALHRKLAARQNPTRSCFQRPEEAQQGPGSASLGAELIMADLGSVMFVSSSSSWFTVRVLNVLSLNGSSSSWQRWWWWWWRRWCWWPYSHYHSLHSHNPLLQLQLTCDCVLGMENIINNGRRCQLQQPTHCLCRAPIWTWESEHNSSTNGAVCSGSEAKHGSPLPRGNRRSP